jgi:hypothetical protein
MPKKADYTWSVNRESKDVVTLKVSVATATLIASGLEILQPESNEAASTAETLACSIQNTCAKRFRRAA